MPLRAIYETQEILAPALPLSKWEELRGKIRAGESTLTLPCCGGRAFQRTSSRGLQHFYHSPESLCDERGETLDHLAAKSAIVKGCEDAGYQARPEWIGEDWRADVLAVKGPIRIAFEVQWSRQSLRSTLARQARYAKAGIRGCWLFRMPPFELRSPYPEAPMMAGQDLPAFLIGGAPGDEPRIYLNGHHYPLHAFVTHLLRGEVRFRSRARLTRWQRVTLLFYEVRCPNCGKPSHVYGLDRRSYSSSCGIEMPLHRFRYDAARAGLRPEIRRAAYAYLLSEEGLQLRAGSMGPREIDGRECLCFSCFHCDAPFDNHQLSLCEDAIQESGRWCAVHDAEVRMSGPFTLDRPHWCLPRNGEYCPR